MESRGKQCRSLRSEDSGFHHGWATDWPLSAPRQVLTHCALGSSQTTRGRVVRLVGRVGGCLHGKLGTGTLTEANHRCVTDPGSLPHWGQGSGEASIRKLAPKVPGNGLSGDLSSVMESSGGGYRWGNRG